MSFSKQLFQISQKNSHPTKKLSTAFDNGFYFNEKQQEDRNGGIA